MCVDYVVSDANKCPCFELFPAWAAVQSRALRKSETRINVELSDLDKSIILKEALLAQIKDGQSSYETMQQVIQFVCAARRT